MNNTNSPFEILLHTIRALPRGRAPLIIAIDGRCAAGKTTLGNRLREALDCNLFHMDDFFLRPEQRTEARLQTAGENVDHERFLAEVLIPLRNGVAFSYRPYDCHTGMLCTPISVMPAPIAIVEGAYACHPSLFPYYDLRVMLNIAADEQMRRIRARNGAAAELFRTRWIPLEENYFASVATPDRFDLCIKSEN